MHLHKCKDRARCGKRWADNILVSHATQCPHCGYIQEIEDRGEISKEACIELGIHYRTV